MGCQLCSEVNSTRNGRVVTHSLLNPHSIKPHILLAVFDFCCQQRCLAKSAANDFVIEFFPHPPGPQARPLQQGAKEVSTAAQSQAIHLAAKSDRGREWKLQGTRGRELHRDVSPSSLIAKLL